MGIQDADILLILGTVLLVGVAFGALAKRLHLPSITGQILAGIGITSTGLFDHDAADTLYPVTGFALGLMAVTIGAHLNLRTLRNAGRRLGLLLLCEAILVPGAVFLAMLPMWDLDWSFSLMLGALAVSTAPATVIALVNETRSKGVFVNTLVAAVALNNMACIVLFEMARFVARDHVSAEGVPFHALLLPALLQVLWAAAIGLGVATVTQLLSRLSRSPQWFATKGLIAILLTVGLAELQHASPLLACLFLGVGQVNLGRTREQIVDVPFSHFMPVILAAFFTVAGMELTLQYAVAAGLVALVFLLARMAGKLLSAFLAMRLASATRPLQRFLGPALVPQAGVAVGLVVLLEEDPLLRTIAPGAIDLFVAVVLTAVVGNELIGPVLTRLCLRRSGETNADRKRLFDFVEEHSIVTGLSAHDMEDAIRQLGDVLARANGLSPAARDGLVESALVRERDTSTCLGEGLAVPHGSLPEGNRIVGVMGLSATGLPFDTPDDKPVHCIVLLATPESQRAHHLEILAALARAVSQDPQVQSLLFQAESPAHAYDILTGEHAANLNYFMDEMRPPSATLRPPMRAR